MFKSIQMKIILIIMVLAIVMFLFFGFLTIKEISVNNNIEGTALLLNKIKFIMYITLGTFIILAGLIIWFTSKEITKPMYKLIDSAKKMTSNEEMSKNKSKTEIDELNLAFEKMSTGMKENVKEIIQQKKQIETILKHMTDGIMAFELSGRIIQINPAAKTLLQIDEKDDNFEKIFKKLKLDINLEKIVYLENLTTTESKLSISEKYINLFFVPFKDEYERPAGLIVIVQDITEHVKLDNMRKEFIADVSHELKTPLTSILGYAETLSNSEYDKEVQEKFLNVITSEAIRMTKLVSDLLTLSKHDDTNTKWEKTEFDLGSLVKKCQEHLQIEMDKKEQKVECFVTSNVPLVYADKDGIERVVLNILSNSIKYTQDGGTIKIYVGFVYNDAYIKIIDNGIGIPEKDLSRIFERFYRVDKARTRAMGGTGLGLSIAKEILDQNGGRIDIKSVVNKGTEVVITIPARTEKKIDKKGN